MIPEDTLILPVPCFPPDKKRGFLIAYCNDKAFSENVICGTGKPENIVVGRGNGAGFHINDPSISRHHCIIYADQYSASIQDLDSTNGTFVNGVSASKRTDLHDGDVVRAGQTVAVYHDDISRVVYSTSDTPMTGPFWTWSIIDEIKTAAASGCHILINGQSGVGKELAACIAVKELTSSACKNIPVECHSAAAFGTEDEAVSTLFGVKPGTYTGVCGRKGLVEITDGGILFIDEAHRYPPRIQSALLRLAETGEYRRPGDEKTMRSSVKLIMATNLDDEKCGLIPDMFTRLLLVKIPSLNQRRADAPAIFMSILKNQLIQHSDVFSQLMCREKSRHEDWENRSQSVIDCIGPDHMEIICLHNYDGENIRMLKKLAMRICGKAARGFSPKCSVSASFFETFGDLFSMVLLRYHQYSHHQSMDEGSSKYDRNRKLISEMYREHKTVSRTARALERAGYSFSQRWLSVHLKQWGIMDSGNHHQGPGT